MTLKEKCKYCGKEVVSVGKEVFITLPFFTLYWKCLICGKFNPVGVIREKCAKCGEEAIALPEGKQPLMAWSETRKKCWFVWNCPNPACHQHVNYVYPTVLKTVPKET